MFQSYRDGEWWTDAEGRTKATLYCVDCELVKRQSEWSYWNGPKKATAGEDYPTMDAVKKDQKKKKVTVLKSSHIHVFNYRPLKSLSHHSDIKRIFVYATIINARFYRI